jgi:uncharacterized tellurite resistance protein B-like protein
MALIIESFLRKTELNANDKDVILRGISQLAAVDGVMDPREREYLKKFVEEFFPEADPFAGELTTNSVSTADVKTLSSDDAKLCFIAFMTITAYADENFSQAEKDLLRKLVGDSVTNEKYTETQRAVRKFLYRRVVFSFSFKNEYLHPGFSREMARRFDISDDEAIEINSGVFNAVMAMKNPAEDNNEVVSE